MHKKDLERIFEHTQDANAEHKHKVKLVKFEQAYKLLSEWKAAYDFQVIQGEKANVNAWGGYNRTQRDRIMYWLMCTEMSEKDADFIIQHGGAAAMGEKIAEECPVDKATWIKWQKENSFPEIEDDDAYYHETESDEQWVNAAKRGEKKIVESGEYDAALQDLDVHGEKVVHD